jgi:hypothetical protein
MIKHRAGVKTREAVQVGGKVRKEKKQQKDENAVSCSTRQFSAVLPKETRLIITVPEKFKRLSFI